MPHVDRDHDTSSPSQLGYRMPAEWEPHAGTWLSWPHNPDTWPDSLSEVRQFYTALIRAIAADETVYINVQDDSMRQDLEAQLRAADVRGDVRPLTIPTNDAWCRDYGPTVLTVARKKSQLPRRLAINWEYNAWGTKYPPFDADNAAALQMAAALGMPVVAGGIVAEGGALDVNGAGLLMTTASCLLNSNRNPHATPDFMEQRLCQMLGVQDVLWLGGDLAGDDTDGHIDNLARFVDATTVLCVEPPPGNDDPSWSANRQILEDWRGCHGERLRVIHLPWPHPVFVDNRQLPASYANFYVTNRSVLLPQYQCPQDAEAREILAACFPDRQIVGIDCTYAIRGLGAIHCLTQQVPAEPE